MFKKACCLYFYVNALLICVFSLTISVNADMEKTIINENNQHDLGSSVKNLVDFRNNLSNVDSGISAAEPGRPPKDFIDVSSNNGVLTAEEYNVIKKYGVKGVVVKLTEGDSYRNPLAPEQIANAKKAGLKVSVYHYAWFNQADDTEQEAQFLSDYMKELNLPLSTVVVNDSENPQMNLENATENAVVFRDTIQKKGFSNIVHYSSSSWFVNGTLDLDILGDENCWVAQWPYAPTENNLLHTDKAGWQWASDLFFPEFSEKQFDISSDYLGKFIKD